MGVGTTKEQETDTGRGMRVETCVALNPKIVQRGAKMRLLKRKHSFAFVAKKEERGHKCVNSSKHGHGAGYGNGSGSGDGYGYGFGEGIGGGDVLGSGYGSGDGFGPGFKEGYDYKEAWGEARGTGRVAPKQSLMRTRDETF